MELPVFYTSAAKETLVITYSFIEQKFGTKTAIKFKNRVAKVIRLIARNPLIYKVSTIADNVRIGYITKQTALFYSVSVNSINLLYFWDNRQDPVINPDK